MPSPPLSLTAVLPTSATAVQLGFSTPFLQNPDATSRNNFAFNTRYGDDVPIYADSVDILSPTTLQVNLQDAMLLYGHYQISLARIANLDGVPIETGGGVSTLPFDASTVGDPLSAFSIKRRVPSWMNTVYGSNLYGLLTATSSWVDKLSSKYASAMKDVINGFLLRLATGADLSVIGQNYGVDRPTSMFNNDALFREIIPVLAAERKAVIKIFYDAFTLIFGGDSQTLGWRIYEIRPNELLIEVPANLYYGLSPGTLASATYLHADATVFSPPSYPGDYLLTDSSIPGTAVDGNVVLLYQVTTLNEIISQIKAAGIELVVDII